MKSATASYAAAIIRCGAVNLAMASTLYTISCTTAGTVPARQLLNVTVCTCVKHTHAAAA